MGDRPTVVVLGATREDPPPGLLDALGDDAELRFAVTTAELRAALPGAEILLVWDFRSDQLRDAWDARDGLRWIHVAGAGVDAVLSPKLLASDVVLTNARGVFDDAMAEYVVMLMLVFAKDLLTTLEAQRVRHWRHRESERLSGATLVMVGAGAIGRAIASRSRSLGMHVVGVARTARPDPDFERVVAIEDLHAVLPEADYVVVAVPLTAETEGMFAARELGLLRPTARLVNVSRGRVVDEEALVAALRRRGLAGAALDVFENEPLPSDSPLWEMPQVVVSPHMSGDFHGWLDALADVFVANYRRWRAGEDLVNVVDKQRGYVASSSVGRETDAR
ncbi:MAG: D-2-hydroxyacid dehydrogenase [Nitriliruptorales bacterium]